MRHPSDGRSFRYMKGIAARLTESKGSSPNNGYGTLYVTAGVSEPWLLAVVKPLDTVYSPTTVG